MTLTYRPADTGDGEVIFQLAKKLVADYEDPMLVDFKRVLPWMERKIHQNISQYTCVLVDGCKAGYYRLSVNADRAELDDLYVLPEYQNRGIGTTVLKKCIASTEKTIFLYVFKRNTGAISLYEKMGFTVEKDVSATRCIMVRNG